MTRPDLNPSTRLDGCVSRDAYLAEIRRGDELEAELEQAERERDEAKGRLADCANSYASWQVEFEAQKARLAKVPALVEAVRHFTDGPGSMAELVDALTVWEQE